jgi:uncharacterized iron-regulated membrane protein
VTGAAMRRLWVNVHLCLGLSLGVLGVFIGITGSILVYDHAIDAWLNPQRYAISGTGAKLAPGEYLKQAGQFLEGRARPANLRYPEEEGMPVTVLARAKDGSGFLNIYLDPPTGRVLDAAPGGGLIGWVHRFHENLTLREYMGREIVGLAGFGMLISSFSGIYLWWPGRGRFRQALGARPGFTLSRNLHYQFGFYASLVLAMLSFTGIWLAYPDPGRAVVGIFSLLSPSPRNVQASEAPGGKPIALGEAMGIAQALHPGASISALGLPAGPRGAYRIGFSGGAVVFVDPASGVVLRRLDPSTRTPGDRFLSAQRALHTGDALGPLGRVLIFAVGLLPALFVVTGTTMWLRQRRAPACSPG